MTRWAWPAIALIAASPAAAQRGCCPECPGLDTPPCVISSGQVPAETGMATPTRDDGLHSRTATVLIEEHDGIPRRL